MASTLKEIVYRLWHKLEGHNQISDDSKYTYRELRGYVRSGIANALKNSYFEQRNLEDFKYGDDSLSASYLADVLTDSDKQLQYVELTSKTISIAGNRFTDINSANPVSAFATMYVPIRLEERFVAGLQKVPCMNYFYKEDGRAYFYGKKVNEAQVLVTDRYSLPNDDDKELGLPEEFENQVLEQAFRLLMPVLPADRENNGISQN